ncbi:GNAT family N-acetyltransferase [Paenibacillus mendelii]|uniref:GNAT family N-acetyltransferase n=1 Tax=Paenibacillus mendelii TaxID=206163 RepID=A0ABV6JI36_9BACL|nr:GNAT family N-acetyltransferase [Paenibacillus mendelii]MCQ6557370.1 GNAT family N-acetyltransferase [Paenibacillus mendelii]
MIIDIYRVQPQDKILLLRMFELYMHDFSEYLEFDLDENGLYGYPYLDLYWTEPGRHPFLIKVSDKLAGFVLVRTVDSDLGPIHSIAEFFIVRKYRRKGIGKQAALKMFHSFPGRWRVVQVERNYPAQTFWRSVISSFTEGKFTDKVEDTTIVQEFTSV